MVDVYTDGSCLGNPGPGGWGAIVLDSDATRLLSGGDPATTNNRMELTAAIKGIEAVPAGAPVAVHSDSEYLVKTMTKGWKRRVNHDLWERLDALERSHKVTWEWVRGHAGNPLNEEADRLAAAAMNEAAGGPAAKPESSRPPSPKPREVAGGVPEASLTHVDADGKAQMVDVGGKPDTERVARALAVVSMRPETLALILQGKVEKGDVFTVARIAGIGAAKRTWDLLPLAHQIPLTHVAVDFDSDPVGGHVTVTATARTTAKTGVEMEALVAVALAGLTIYDMCKAVDRGMSLGEVRLLEKRGGASGDYTAPA